MSWQDRGYYRNPTSFGGGGMGMSFPKPTLYVKYLLIANIVIFVFSLLFRIKGNVEDVFALPGAMGFASFLQPWRLISYQFLHGDGMHLFFNMLGLYFFGPPLERFWGSKRFLFFYLLCGAMGGLAFIVLSTLMGDPIPIIGASGAILGLLTACAVLFPQMMIIMVFFPLPIRFAAILLAAIYGLNVLQSRNLADACHLAGMVTGFLYIKGGPWFHRFQRERDDAKWDRLMKDEQTDQNEVDRILEKVHQQGIQSLTGHEKKVLRDATRRQQERDKYRKDY